MTYYGLGRKGEDPMPTRRGSGRTQYSAVPDFPEARLVQWRRNETNPGFEAQFRLLTGQWSQFVSLPTTDIEEARRLARVGVWRLREGKPPVERQRVGDPVPMRAIIQPGPGAPAQPGRLPKPRTAKVERDFSHAADVAIKALEAAKHQFIEEVTGEPGRRSLLKGDPRAKKLAAFNIPLGRIQNLLIPAFGGRDVRDVDHDVVAEFAAKYRVTRRVHHEDGRVEIIKALPKGPTVMGIDTALAKVFKAANRLKWMDGRPRPKILLSDFTPSTSAQRPELTLNEMKFLLAQMTDAWVLENRLAVTRENRRLLRVWVALLATTGARPGTELSLLQWNRVSAPGGELQVKIRGGKTKTERVVAVDERIWPVTPLLNDLRRHQGHPSGERFVFTRPDGSLPIFTQMCAELLEEFGLRKTQDGQTRVAYSARHGFATSLLDQGTSPYDTALLLGTSLGQIEGTYSHRLALNAFRALRSRLSPDANPAAAIERATPEEKRDLVQAYEQMLAVETQRAEIVDRTPGASSGGFLLWEDGLGKTEHTVMRLLRELSNRAEGPATRTLLVVPDWPPFTPETPDEAREITAPAGPVFDNLQTQASEGPANGGSESYMGRDLRLGNLKPRVRVPARSSEQLPDPAPGHGDGLQNAREAMSPAASLDEPAEPPRAETNETGSRWSPDCRRPP